MLIITIVPFIELRGSIPYGMAAGLNPWLVIWSCIAINILLIPVLFFILTFIFHKLTEIPVFGKWMERKLNKIHRKAGKYVDKYGPIGLALFVGVPLPGSGAYTGALAAFLLTMDKKRAIGAIAVGVIIAGVIISLASLGFVNFFL